MIISDELNKLLDILPDFIQKALEEHPYKDSLIEVVMDLGRRPEARFPSHPEYLSDKRITLEDLEFATKRIGSFSGDNRAGIQKTLHRISSLRNREGQIIGLTCRVGRAVYGTISVIRDLLESGESILLLGKPGVGKTTAIREIARVLADEMQKRVVVIDTSNEIAGDGDIPHPGIGRARRMQVPKPELQHQVMIEAVENHMPQVIIIDEISTELEALAARTIAERGVQLVGTAHGEDLNSLVKNPSLADLIGGIQDVTLGDEEAKRRGSQKSILERKAPPAFNIGIEIQKRDQWNIHNNLKEAVDYILQGEEANTQQRTFNLSGETTISPYLPQQRVNVPPHTNFNFLHSQHPIKSTENIIGYNFLLYSYSINERNLQQVITDNRLPIYLTYQIDKADIILSLRDKVENNQKLKEIANSRNIPIYTVTTDSSCHLLTALKELLNISTDEETYYHNSKEVEEALEETRIAIENIILNENKKVELLPRSANIRKAQHHLLHQYNLKGYSFGQEPNRRLRIYA